MVKLSLEDLTENIFAITKQNSHLKNLVQYCASCIFLINFITEQNRNYLRRVQSALSSSYIILQI